MTPKANEHPWSKVLMLDEYVLQPVTRLNVQIGQDGVKLTTGYGSDSEGTSITIYRPQIGELYGLLRRHFPYETKRWEQ